MVSNATNRPSVEVVSWGSTGRWWRYWDDDRLVRPTVIGLNAQMPPPASTLDLLSRRAQTVRSSAVRDLLRLTEQPDVLSLAGGLPAPELLPADRVAASTVRILAEQPTVALQYGPTEGTSALRMTVAERLGERARADETIITTGSQQALDLIARVLLDPGDAVVAESPTYLGALGALHWASPQIVGIDGDIDGLRTDILERRLGAGLRPKLVYVVTEFANPTGATLSSGRRAHLAALADTYGFVIVEDNPYGALRFRGDHRADGVCARLGVPPRRPGSRHAATVFHDAERGGTRCCDDPVGRRVRHRHSGSAVEGERRR